MKRTGIRYTAVLIAAALLVSGCGKQNTGNRAQEAEEELTPGEGQALAEEQAGNEGQTDETEQAAGTEQTVSGASGDAGSVSDTDTPESRKMRELFGENCIAEQCFEVELNGCEGEVWFVPFEPSADDPVFHAQVMRDGEILAQISPYVPAGVSGKSFTSLDAVSFWDVNFDGLTDIVMIVTYGDQQFAAIYYGDYYQYSDGDESWSFRCMEELSGGVSARAADTMTVPNIRGILSGGKKNGEFDSYAEAYEAVISLSEMEQGEAPDEDFLYDLIYVDEDEIPELVSGKRGYYVNLYTYQDGTLYTLMYDWGYGAMGNAGYEYAPRENSLRNYNADQAGAIMHTYYMRISEQHTIETPVWIESYNFDDANGNGWLDEEETYGEGAEYINGEKASEEEMADVYAFYDMGEYQYIEGRMTAEDVRHALK